MKKEYIKPFIVFESFTLSTNIAASCERVVNNPTKGVCGIPGSAPGLDVFTDKVQGCAVYDYQLDGDNDGRYNGFCYDVPSPENQLFNS